MPTPKSVIKVVKSSNGGADVEFEIVDNVDATNYYIWELNRAALRDVGKYIRSGFRNEFYKHFKRHSGKGGNACSYKVWSNKNTIYPRVDVGLRIKNKMPGFYAYFQEVGTTRQPKLGLLTNFALSHGKTFEEIEGQYLSALGGDTSTIESKINDSEEYEEDD